MFFLRKAITSIKLSNRSLLYISKRSGFVIRDWKPGPYPKTEEERIAAAKKYNMIPEDYQPCPEDYQVGDYPYFEPYGYNARDPYENWDNPYTRTNYNEPIHIFEDFFQPERMDPNMKIPLSGREQFFLIFKPILLLLFMAFVGEYFDLRTNLIMKPKQYPGPGKVHYTFEPEYD